jgi:putative ABC transport system ATP-binding protein
MCWFRSTNVLGEIILKWKSIKPKSEDELANIRNQNIGFIFQNFQLMPTLTALEMYGTDGIDVARKHQNFMNY